MMLGYGLQLVISLLFTAVLAVALCYTILNMEKIYASFISTEKKAAYFTHFIFQYIQCFYLILLIRSARKRWNSQE